MHEQVERDAEISCTVTPEADERHPDLPSVLFAHPAHFPLTPDHSIPLPPDDFKERHNRYWPDAHFRKSATMSVPVGITVPKLLPITGTFAPLFASYFGLLSFRVVSHRLDTRKYFGLPQEPANPSAGPDDLTVASRCHANFTENVPLALLLGAIVELNGGNRKVLTGGLSALLLFRIMHVEFGLLGENQLGKGRSPAYYGTLGYIIGFGGYAAYLVKGYWGF